MLRASIILALSSRSGTPYLNKDGGLLSDLPSSQFLSSYGFVALPGIWSSGWKAQISLLEQLKLNCARPMLDTSVKTTIRQIHAILFTQYFFVTDAHRDNHFALVWENKHYL